MLGNDVCTGCKAKRKLKLEWITRLSYVTFSYPQYISLKAEIISFKMATRIIAQTHAKLTTI